MCARNPDATKLFLPSHSWFTFLLHSHLRFDIGRIQQAVVRFVGNLQAVRSGI